MSLMEDEQLKRNVRQYTKKEKKSKQTTIEKFLARKKYRSEVIKERKEIREKIEEIQKENEATQTLKNLKVT